MAAGPASAAPRAAGIRGHGRHVLLLSVDGLHQSDPLVRAHPPASALAAWSAAAPTTPVPARRSRRTPSPAWSGQLTGGNPATTGVYYDDTFNRALLPAGHDRLRRPRHRAPRSAYTEDLDTDNDAAWTPARACAGLPGSILAMTGNPQTLIDPAQLPVDPRPASGLPAPVPAGEHRVRGRPRGTGCGPPGRTSTRPTRSSTARPARASQDLFTPEINSDAPTPAGDDWTHATTPLTQQYDGYKVQAVVNEIDGYDHSGTPQVGVPAIFGMNFQTVSTAQKLPTSDGLTGGYLPGGTVPGPLLQPGAGLRRRAGRRDAARARAATTAGDSTLILSAKHGQSPTDPAALTPHRRRADHRRLDAGWAAAHPGAAPLVAFAIDDDGCCSGCPTAPRRRSSSSQDYLTSHARPAATRPAADRATTSRRPA